MEIISSQQFQKECLRCGECCRKGSPTLHLTDAELIKKGTLSYGNLYTIRKGECVYNNINDEVIPIDYELIKIREKGGNRTCIFLMDEGNECSIYEDRPLQCREQECWNPERLESAFQEEEKLTREHLAGDAPVLKEVLEQHEERCSYELLHDAIEKVRNGQDSVHHILNALQYDTDIRPILHEKLGIPYDYLPLLLGRPLVETIKGFGYEVEEDEEGNYCLSIYGNEEN